MAKSLNWGKCEREKIIAEPLSHQILSPECLGFISVSIDAGRTYAVKRVKLLFGPGYTNWKMDLALKIMTIKQNYLKTANMKSFKSRRDCKVS